MWKKLSNLIIAVLLKESYHCSLNSLFSLQFWCLNKNDFLQNIAQQLGLCDMTIIQWMASMWFQRESNYNFI